MARWKLCEENDIHTYTTNQLSYKVSQQMHHPSEIQLKLHQVYTSLCPVTLQSQSLEDDYYFQHFNIALHMAHYYFPQHADAIWIEYQLWRVERYDRKRDKKLLLIISWWKLSDKVFLNWNYRERSIEVKLFYFVLPIKRVLDGGMFNCMELSLKY